MLHISGPILRGPFNGSVFFFFFFHVHSKTASRHLHEPSLGVILSSQLKRSDV